MRKRDTVVRLLGYALFVYTVWICLKQSADCASKGGELIRTTTTGYECVKVYKKPDKF